MRLTVAILLFVTTLLAQNQPPSPGPVEPITNESAAKESTSVSSPDSFDILTDTRGVDFNPYLRQVTNSIREWWSGNIPKTARKPESKKGTVVIEFAILPDGRIAGMKLVQRSGDVNFDRAAWQALAKNSPFPSLPSQFKGPYIGLRFRFLYNPDFRNVTPNNSTDPH